MCFINNMEVRQITKRLILFTTIICLQGAGGCRDSVGEDVELTIKTQYQLEAIQAGICVAEIPLRDDSSEVFELSQIYNALLDKYHEKTFIAAELPTRELYDLNSELKDLWNRPYVLHLNGERILLTSCGPNRIFENGLQDDISIELSNCE